MTTNRPLKVFLCHSSADKPAVRELYQKLRSEPWIQPWLDEEDIFPGMEWNLEIQKAIRETDVILVCLSRSSVTKEGYVQREIKTALDYADEKPDGTIYIIPVRLEECKPPERLSKWQYADYFEEQRERSFKKLLTSLKKRADSLGLDYETYLKTLKKLVDEIALDSEKKHYSDLNKISKNELKKHLSPKQTQKEDDAHLVVMPVWLGKTINRFIALLENEQTNDDPPKVFDNKWILFNGMELMHVPAGKFIMGGNIGAEDEKPQHTVDIPYDYWMARFLITHEQFNVYVKDTKIYHPVTEWEEKKNHPVENLSWPDAMEYCEWLNNLLLKESFFKRKFHELVLRLPTEAEWEKAARGVDGRWFPWGNEFDKNKCNSREGNIYGTTPVGLYSPRGDSPYGCADMAGNVWEWTHSLKKKYPYKVNDGREDEHSPGYTVIRGGSNINEGTETRCTYRYERYRTGEPKSFNSIGFRVCIAPPISSLTVARFPWGK